jgi:antitoxin HicB
LKLEAREDGYLAYFPALRGCHTWGRTYEEAVKHAEEALTLYLETLAENGQPIPEERTSAPVSLGITVRTPIIA